jgi:hypothetical protein
MKRDGYLLCLELKAVVQKATALFDSKSIRRNRGAPGDTLLSAVRFYRDGFPRRICSGTSHVLERKRAYMLETNASWSSSRA